MVEMALAFVVLLILLAGVIDLGRAFFTFMAMRDAAQEGATYGSLYPSDTNGIISRVRNSSSQPVNLSNVAISVQVTVLGTACHGNGIQIDVNYENFPLIMPFTPVFLGRNTLPIRAKVIDEILRPPCN